MPLDFLSRFLFPAPPSSYGLASFSKELIFVPKMLELRDRCPPEQCIPCLFLRYPSARFLILYLHSNAEDLGKCYGFCGVLREQFQVHVIAVEYPGYGLCPGGPATADSVTENAFAVFRFIREVVKWPLDGIKIFGRSIGTGPAISLAVQYKVAGLILVAPFLSIKALLQDAVGPLAYLVEERFPNRDRVHLIRSPVLIVHGQRDTLIPSRHGDMLYDLFRARKLLVCPEQMEHNTNLLSDVGYLVLPMLQFFSLPDYCFEEIDVPLWAYEPKLCSETVVDRGFRPEPDFIVAAPRRSKRMPITECAPLDGVGASPASGLWSNRKPSPARSDPGDAALLRLPPAKAATAKGVEGQSSRRPPQPAGDVIVDAPGSWPTSEPPTARRENEVQYREL